MPLALHFLGLTDSPLIPCPQVSGQKCPSSSMRLSGDSDNRSSTNSGRRFPLPGRMAQVLHHGIALADRVMRAKAKGHPAWMR